jgi:two-component system, OmpR family, sensor histidine kinase KdpD
MDPEQPNPDVLLARLKRQEAEAGHGKLKVFFGMAPGVGKTYAMLEAARREFASGRDVVIGCVETHGRKETEALTLGLPEIPRLRVVYRGVSLSEFDLDAVLRRRPQLVLVDEFAHTNAPGLRHPKRYQDILEVLEAGIDVFTTLNVQHLESRAEVVCQITGIAVRETVPDHAVAQAEFELVDLAPDELRGRLAEGKVYVPESAGMARDNFFRKGNLTALRELALRFVAEHVGEDVVAYRQAHNIQDPWKSGHRLLVAVSSSPTSASLTRWTCRLAGELRASWVAVHVEVPASPTQEAQEMLGKNLALVRELGGQVVSTSDDDVVRGILRVAREQNATQIVVGKPAGWRALELLRGGSLLNRLIRSSGNIDIHAVRAEEQAATSCRPAVASRFAKAQPRDYGIALAVVAGVTGVNAILQQWLGHQSLALVYLLSVIVLAMFVARGATLLAATLTAFLWDFLFTEPRFKFRIDDTSDWMMFCTYFVVACAMGHLAARLRAQQASERHREQRATALYLLTRELAQASDYADLLAIIIREVGKATNAQVALSLPGGQPEGTLTPYFVSTWSLDEKELSVASWAFSRRQPCGRTTDTLPSAEGLHLPLLAAERVLGVMSLRFKDAAPLTTQQQDLLQAFTNQIGLVLDRQRLRDAEQDAKLIAESERLSRTLLNSISHEIRTPLAAITTAASALTETDSGMPLHTTLLAEIQEAAERLNRLVGNLLSMTRLEAGHIRPRLDWCDVGDLVHSAWKDLKRELSGRAVKLDVATPLPPVRMDFILTQQSLSNLLLNAAVHTPAGTPIDIRVSSEGSELVLTVADRGPGLSAESLSCVFNKFYRAPTAPVGGTGLGLAIVKGFVEAQNGRVTAENRAGGGAVFSIRLPLIESPPIVAETSK